MAPPCHHPAMERFILTGASRGIGAALAGALARPGRELWLSARESPALTEAADRAVAVGAAVQVRPADQARLDEVERLARDLLEVPGPVTLILGAGLWPHRCEHVEGGLERAFVVNHLAPVLLAARLLAAGQVTRVFFIGAGLMIKGRFDEDRTPAGRDFSSWRTYCDTKLCQALAAQHLAGLYPDVDFGVTHPGVVRTDLGARPGVLGGVLRLVKRKWETPEACAARLASVVETPRWGDLGAAGWWFEKERQAWPAPADDAALRDRVWTITARLLDERGHGL